MDFAQDATTVELVARMNAFLAECVYPAEAVLDSQVAETPDDWNLRPIVRELQAEARSRGLWNLFLPAEGLTNLQYAAVAELTGRSPKLAPVALNCAAPDTGNMEVLAEFGTAQQKERWLKPLLEGRIRSSF